ncbi:MAG: tetratricopeptide repeat protein [Acidobacteriota bacterium]|nr:tetratricopeptide repeat protein [Acidobacteriota bacterium]
MNAQTDWASAVSILAAGLILGSLFVFFFNKRRTAKTLGGERDLALQDLEAKRDALVAQLRDPAIAADERARLERETADVLRQLDAAPRTQRGSEEPSGARSASAMDPTIKGFLWGAGSMAALAALGFFVMQQATPRQEGGVPTGGMTAAQPQQQQQQPVQSDPQVQQLEAAVQREPNNLQLRNDLAQAYLERENLMGVFEQTKFVLEKSPDDARALTFQGLVRMAMGDPAEATKMLQHATQADPKNLDSWVALAWIYAQSDRLADAQKMINEAAKQSPNDKPRLEQLFAQMKQQLAQNGNQELPPNHPPIDGAPAVAAAPGPSAAPAGPAVRVSISLANGAPARGGVLFVIARNGTGGPPVAVKRVVATQFPMTVELTSADSMMGQPLPPTFRVEARLDSDGDPLTKPATDPSAMQEGVTPGASVALTLK